MLLVFGLSATIISVGGAALLMRRGGSNSSKVAPPPSQDLAPFTDLDTALASLRASHWELSIPPRRSGPYRLLPEGTCIGPNPSESSGGRIQNTNGTVVEEITLRGLPDRDQTIAYLETVDGHQTMAVMIRMRSRERALPGEPHAVPNGRE
jgi:hypothetical protein